MKFTRLEATFWLFGVTGHLVLLLILLVRSRWRTFPFFTSLIGYQLVESLLLYLVSQHGTSHAYFLTYWWGAVGDYVSQVALIAEIAVLLCRRQGVWIQTARAGVFRWALFGVLLAAVVCYGMTPLSLTGPDLWDERAALFTSLLTCQLMLGVSLTGNRLRLQRERRVMALGQGLALWSTAAVIGDVLKALTGWKRDFPVFDELRMLVYLGDLLFWCFVFWRPAMNPVPAFEQVDSMVLLQNIFARPTEPPPTDG